MKKDFSVNDSAAVEIPLKLRHIISKEIRVIGSLPFVFLEGVTRHYVVPLDYFRCVRSTRAMRQYQVSYVFFRELKSCSKDYQPRHPKRRRVIFDYDPVLFEFD